MERLYKKSELAFALVWIGVYCVLQSLANPLNDLVGVQYAASAVLCAVQAVVLFAFAKRNKLLPKFGICKTKISAARFLFYIPLLLLMSRNFWNGVAVNLPLLDTVCYLICMLCVGFVEELIFRGLLFQAMAKDNVKVAITISSVTFGLGHFLNLINGSGADLLENLLQVTGAIAIGFLFVILFHRGGSLWPCIIAHSFINMSSVFASEAGLTPTVRLIFQGILFLIAIGYALILLKTLPKKAAEEIKA